MKSRLPRIARHVIIRGMFTRGIPDHRPRFTLSLADAPRLGFLLLMVVNLFGCATSGLSQAQLDRAKNIPAYPAISDYGPNRDIIVVRRGDTIQLVNRTARSYDHVNLWLNRQYVRPVKHIGIGTDNTLNLTTFFNKFGEPYPVGTFLTPESNVWLVLAELYDPKTKLRYRLNVQALKTRNQQNNKATN